MNRREFVRGSFLSSLAGLAGGDFLLTQRPADAETSKRPASSKLRIYAHLLDPREHPDYARHHVQPPNWETFGNHTRFATLRGFEIKENRIIDYSEIIQKYTTTYKLGDVLWPAYPILFAENLGDLADEIRQRNLFLFDVWAYVPGSGPGSIWQQFQPPPGVFKLLTAKLGDHWLGMDNGEQDGRYIGGYSEEMYPSSGSRMQQYFNFQRFFERLTDQLGNRMSTLVSLNFGHYFLKEGVYTLIGAETGEALPNGQLYYSFIRGAGKQYGVPWFGNSSGWNRWGWKVYGPEEHSGSVTGGPTKGTSLSLMKRLMYNHILYNAMLVGFDQGWFYRQKGERMEGASPKAKLSPLGRIQQAARQWVKKEGQPGTMLTPIAVMLDFYAGWTFPRQLYTPNVYRVWGNLPYAPGDYLTDGVLDMLYPGYQDSSYFHNEAGFIAPTPYGDAADCLLSDAEGWLLTRYALLVIAGELAGGAEVRDKLEDYVRGGGHLVITAGNLAKSPAGLAGIEVTGKPERLGAGESVVAGTTTLVENTPFDVYPLAFPKAARVLAKSAGIPVAVEMAYGEGRITVFASPFGVGAKQSASAGVLAEEVKNPVDKPLSKPYPLLKHVRRILDEVFRRQMLFEAGEGQSLITCRKGPGEYTLGISNNTWRQQPLKIVSRCGRIERLRELPLDQSEKGAIGYVPEGLEKLNLGTSGNDTIAGGDIRIFAVRVREEHVEEIEQRVPPRRPQGRFLPLRNIHDLKEEVLARPTFFEHFDGVVVDWRYLERREKSDLKQEAGWIGRQKLRIIVDLTSGINLYPNLRLVDNIPVDFAASMTTIEDVMEKMGAFQARDLILSLHRYPETNFTRKQTWKSFDAAFERLGEEAAKRDLTLHLRMSPGKPPADLDEAMRFIGQVGAANLRLAPSTALMLARDVDPQQAATLIRNKVGLWLVSAPRTDVVGKLWNADAPIAGCKALPALAGILAIDPHAPIVFDAVYGTQDEEYLDAKTLQELLA